MLSNRASQADERSIIRSLCSRHFIRSQLNSNLVGLYPSSMYQVPGYSLTRAIVSSLDEVLATIIAKIGTPIPGTRFGKPAYFFPLRNPQTMVAGKLVRVASGLDAAMRLIDLGFIAEAAALLRNVSDHASQVLAICEGLGRNPLTKDQQSMVDQFFLEPIVDVEQFKDAKAPNYVGRNAVYKASRRAAEEANVDDPESFLARAKLLDVGYDGYVHGSEATTMDLWDAAQGRFMVNGEMQSQSRENAMHAFVGKLYFGLLAFEVAALRLRLDEVGKVAHDARIALDVSPEYSSRDA